MLGFKDLSLRMAPRFLWDDVSGRVYEDYSCRSRLLPIVIGILQRGMQKKTQTDR